MYKSVDVPCLLTVIMTMTIMMMYSSSMLGVHPLTTRGYNQHRSLHHQDTGQQKTAMRKNHSLLIAFKLPLSVFHSLRQRRRNEKTSQGVAALGSPHCGKAHQTRREGADDGEGGSERWRGVNPWRQHSCFCFEFVVKSAV